MGIFDDGSGAVLALAVLVAAAGAGCGPDRPRGQPEGRLEERVLASVDSLRTAYVEAYNAADSARVASMFGDDAVYFPPASEPREGREAIRSYLADELARGTRLSLTPARTEVVTGGWAIDHGSWSAVVDPDGTAKQRTVEGSYLAVIRRVADEWRFVRFSDSYDALPAVPIPEAVR